MFRFPTAAATGAVAKRRTREWPQQNPLDGCLRPKAEVAYRGKLTLTFELSALCRRGALPERVRSSEGFAGADSRCRAVSLMD
jgi:hypothetical protein